ncbi:MAG: HAD family hydrolase [Candidatus Zixiibacteriota bacterium]
MTKLSPRAVIFDLGSTLIEYEPIPWSELSVICVQNAHRKLTASGIDLPDEQTFLQAFESIRDKYRAEVALSCIEWTIPQVAEEMFRKMGIDADDALPDRFFSAYYEPVAERLYAYDDAVDVLTRVKERVSKVGLVSNTIFPEETHRGELNRFGLKSFFDFTLFSSTFGRRKPHQEIFYKAANLAGCAPSECVYIGDRYREDIEGPTAVGMSAILKLVDGRDYPEDLAGIRQIRSLSELNRYMDI